MKEASQSDKPFKIEDHREKDFYIAQRDLVRRAGRVIGPYGIAVYNSLLCHADDRKESWPGLATIAEECGMSKMQVIRTIKLLVSINMIEVVRGKGHTNKYHLLDKKHWHLPEVVTVSDQLKEKPVTDSDRLTGKVVTDSDQLGSKVVTHSDQLTDKVVTHSDPKYNKRSLKRSLSRASDFSKGEKPPEKNIGLQVNYPEKISNALDSFDEDTKIAVQSFLDMVTGHNKTGRMSESRYLALLEELKGVSKKAPVDAFREAVRKAITNEAYSVNYIKKILADGSNRKREQPVQEQMPFSQRPKTTYECTPRGIWFRVEGEERTQIPEDEVPGNVLRRHRGDPPPKKENPAGTIIGAVCEAMTMPAKEARNER